MNIFGLPLPSTEIALIGFVIAILAATFGDKILNPITRRTSTTTHHEPLSKGLPYRYRFGIIVLIVLSLELLVYGLFSLWIDHRNATPKHSSSTQKIITEYIKRRTCLINQVKSESSAYYKLKAVDSMEGVENLGDTDVQVRTAVAQTDLNKLIQEYHLKDCK